MELSRDGQGGRRESLDRRLRRGVFCSVEELVAAIDDYLTHYNVNPKPFAWSTTVVTVSPLVAAKLELYETMRRNGVTHVELRSILLASARR